jgi:hypothetical protein
MHLMHGGDALGRGQRPATVQNRGPGRRRFPLKRNRRRAPRLEPSRALSEQRPEMVRIGADRALPWFKLAGGVLPFPL